MNVSGHFVNRSNSVFVKPADVAAFYSKKVKIDGLSDAEIAAQYGVGGSPKALRDAVKYAIDTMDDAPQIINGAPAQIANGSPLAQFLQVWLPGAVKVLQAPLRGVEIFGKVNTGDLATQSVILRTIENKGRAALYQGLADVPLSNYNFNAVWRTPVTLAAGYKTGAIEQATMSAMGFDDTAEREYSVRHVLQIVQNAIHWNGYVGGTALPLGRTFGIMNDPNLPTYIPVPDNAAGTSSMWDDKTAEEIFNDVIFLMNELAKKTRGHFDVRTSKCALIMPVGVETNMNKVFMTGARSVWDVVTTTFKGLTVWNAPQMELAVSGENAIYLVAETKVEQDESTDNGSVISLIDMFDIYLLSSLPNTDAGIDNRYLMKTAGALVTRPLLIARAYGV